MAYNKHTWVTGEIISATKLNNMEDGIARNDSEIGTISETAEAIQAELETKAEIDGAYEGMTVGNAEQLVSTVMIEDSEPYLYRTSGGSADIGNREYDKIVGGSIAWNQMIEGGDFADGQRHGFTGSSWAVTTGEMYTSSSGQAALRVELPNMVKGHVYLASFAARQDSAITNPMKVGFNATSIATGIMDGNVFGGSTSTEWIQKAYVIKPNVESTIETLGLRWAWTSALPLMSGEVVHLKNVMLFDLTQMYGTAVADAVYAMEQANAGAGTSWFKAQYPELYYEYNEGELKSVEGLVSHDMVGFNAYNPETGKAKVIGGHVYQITGTYTALSLNGDTITPDANGYFTPDETGEIAVTGGNATNTCIHLKWSGTRDGEYEPYVKHSYPLDSTVVLRGIPKLDSNGTVYYDGDTYEADGTVTRRYGIVDLGTLTWARGLQGDNYLFNAVISGLKTGTTYATQESDIPFFGLPYSYKGAGAGWTAMRDKSFGCNSTTLRIRDDSYTDAASFKSAMSGVMLVYELATPATEQAEPFATPQIVEEWGTEEYVTTGLTPVGHETQYPSNLRDKLQHLPDLADNDGAYLIQQTGTQMALVAFRIPKAENLEDGTYTLKATVSGGTPTYTWEAE